MSTSGGVGVIGFARFGVATMLVDAGKLKGVARGGKGIVVLSCVRKNDELDAGVATPLVIAFEVVGARLFRKPG